MSVEVSIEMEVPAPNPGAMNEALFFLIPYPNTVTYHARQYQKKKESGNKLVEKLVKKNRDQTKQLFPGKYTKSLFLGFRVVCLEMM